MCGWPCSGPHTAYADNQSRLLCRSPTVWFSAQGRELVLLSINQRRLIADAQQCRFESTQLQRQVRGAADIFHASRGNMLITGRFSPTQVSKASSQVGKSHAWQDESATVNVSWHCPNSCTKAAGTRDLTRVETPLGPEVAVFHVTWRCGLLLQELTHGQREEDSLIRHSRSLCASEYHLKSFLTFLLVF